MKKQPTQTIPAVALATELRIVAAKLSRRLREQARPGDYTAAQKSVILRLERDGPATVTTLARAEGVKPQSLGATVATLETAGLICGAPDPSDGRQTVLSLSENCREILRVSRAAKEDWLHRAITANLDNTEQAELHAALQLLTRIAEFDPKS